MLPDGVVRLELVCEHLRQGGRRGLWLCSGSLSSRVGAGAWKPAAVSWPGLGVSALHRWENSLLTSEPAVQCKLACSKPAAPKSDSFILLLYRHVPDTHDHGERKSVLACTEGRETRGRARQCIMGLTQKDTWIQGHTCRLFSLLSECARLTVNGNWNTSRNPQREDIEIEEKGLRPKQYIP